MRFRKQQKANVTVKTYHPGLLVGDTIIVKNYDPNLNGKTGVIDRIDGEYYYVSIPMPTGSCQLELYACEMRSVDPVRRSTDRNVI